MIKNIHFDNVTLCTETFGDNQNPAILLIMGSASSMIWWEEPFCNALVDKGFFVIRYDNRDTGKSTFYPAGQPEYSVDDLADDAIKILDAYNIEKATVMGFSMGGFIAQIIGVKYPQRVNALVLGSTMYFAEGAEKLPIHSDEVNALFSQVGTKQPETLDELLDYQIEQWKIMLKSDRPKEESHAREMNKLDYERADNFDSRFNHMLAKTVGDELARISEISAPTLILHGTQDSVVNYVHGQMLQKTIPNATLLTMEGAGHEIHPLDYNDIIEGICKLQK